MKKVISIFLLLLMLVVGTHPVLAMHFCAGELYSFNVSNLTVEKACCAAMNDNPTHQDKDTCHDDQDSQSKKALLSHKSCCNIQKVELSTDSYQHQLQKLNLNNIFPSFENIWLVLNTLIPTKSEDITETNQNFSSRGLYLSNTKLLTFICIYRI